MIGAYELYQDVLDVITQEENGQLTSERFNRIANTASLKLFKELVENQTDPRLKNFLQSTEDMLAPFIKQQPMYTDRGRSPKPEDFGYFKNMRTVFDDARGIRELTQLYSMLCDPDPTVNQMEVQDQIDALIAGEGFVDVQLMASQKISTRARSYLPTKVPSKRKPVVEFVNDGFLMYPKESATVLLTYYRLPKKGRVSMGTDPVTLDLVHTPAGSIDWEWPQMAKDLLVLYIAQVYGVSKRERDLFQMLGQVKQETKQ